MKMNAMKSVIPLLGALAYVPAPALASPIMGSELASFAVLGASTVTNTGSTTLLGNLGVSPGSAITGKATITVNGTNASTLGNPHVHENDAFAILAQTQLATARTNLGLMGPGTLLPADLVGLTILPGVYTVPAGVSNLTGAVTLDGLGNANAAWVFQMESTLITSASSVVNVINTGDGAGVYWNVAVSATLGASTSFEGNILADIAISLGNSVTIGCGRALAHTAAVSMDTDTIDSIGCTGTGEDGSDGLSGGLDVSIVGDDTVVSFLPFVPVTPGPGTDVPEPAMLLLFGLGVSGLLVSRKKFAAVG